MNRACRRGIVFALLVLSGGTGHAHTLAGTMVSVTPGRDNEVNITIAAEADPLIAKLEALAGVSASEPPATSRDRRDRLASLSATLGAHIDARLAGSPLLLVVHDVVVDDTAQTEIHLTAKVPAARSTFTWRCTFIFGAYQLSTRNGNGVEAIEWLQGPQTSKSVALQGSRPGVNRVAVGLAMTALVVFIIGRRAIAVSGLAGVNVMGSRMQADAGGHLYESERPIRRYSGVGCLEAVPNVSTRCRTISPGTLLPFSSTKPPRSSIWRGSGR